MSDETQNTELHDIVGLAVRVTFDLPFCLYLEDGLYEVSRGDWTSTITLERVIQSNLDPRLGIQESTSELARDRYGRLRYTKVTVETPAKVIIEKELRRQVAEGELQATEGVVSVNLAFEDLTSHYTQVAYEEALNVANRLIEVYRQVTDAFYIRRVPAEDIFQADINWYEDGELLGGTHQSSFGHGMTLQPTVTPQILDALRARLKSDDEIPIPFELFQDSRDRLDRGEYRLAIIDARTALEVYIDGVLLGYFEACDISVEQVCQILDVRRGRVETLQDALQQAEINRKVGHGLKVALSIDIHDGNPQLWQRWLSAKVLRERAAHHGEQVARSEAIEAVNSMGEIMTDIRQALQSAPWLYAEPDVAAGDS